MLFLEGVMLKRLAVVFFLIAAVQAVHALTIESAGNALEFNENLTSISAFLDSSHLAVLHDGSIGNEHGKFEYRQTLSLPAGRIIFATDYQNRSGLHVNNTPRDYLFIPGEAYRLKISFSPSLKSGHNAGFLDDLTGKKIMLLGKEFEITKAMHPAQGSVALSLVGGSSIIELNDTNTSDAGNGKVTFNGKAFNNVRVDIKSSGDGGTEQGADVLISSIEIYYSADGIFMGRNENLSIVAALEDQSSVLFDAFDIVYEGLSNETAESIAIRAASINDYKLEFTSRAGIRYSVPIWAQATSTSNITVGDNVGSTVRNLNIFENQSISDDEYFLVISNNYSRILQFKDVQPGADNTDSAADQAGKIIIKDTGSGDLLEVYYATLQGDLVLDGSTYKVNVSEDHTSASLFVDLDGSGNNPAEGTAVVNRIHTKNGAVIQLGVRNSSNAVRVPGPGTYSSEGIAGLGYNMSYVIFSSERDEDNARTNITIVFGRNQDNEIDIARIEGTDILSNRVGASFLYEDYIYNETPSFRGKNLPAYGYFLALDQKGTEEQDDLFISYPDSQAKASVEVIPSVPGAVIVDQVETFFLGAGTPTDNSRNSRNEITVNVSYPAFDSIEDTLSEGETKSYTVNEKPYEVTLDFAGSAQTKFTVNGEVTDALGENQQQILSDSSVFSVMDIISQEFAGGTRKVRFNISAAKEITLESCTLDWNGTNESMPVSPFGCIVKKPAVPGKSYTFMAFTEYSSGLKGVSDRITLKENRRPRANITIVHDTNAEVSAVSLEETGNINYSAALPGRGWNVLFVPTVAIMGAFGMTFENTQGWNAEYFFSTRGRLFNNYTLVYYNEDGASDGWKLLMRGERNRSDLRYVNNTNARPYLINTTVSNLTFVI